MQISKDGITCFTDGASSGNPGPGGYGAVVVNPVRGEVSELGGGKPKTTNNEMELSAVVAALSQMTMNELPITIVTDSSYVMKGATEWYKGWQARDWKTVAGDPVANRELWETLVFLLEQRKSKVSWKLVKGHADTAGNNRADTIATANATGKSIELYRGRLDAYPVSGIETIPETPTASSKTSSSKSGPAYSYLSLLDNVLMRHKTWAECEARVRGQAAKFRKAMSAADEKEIVTGWGLDPKTLDSAS